MQTFESAWLQLVGKKPALLDPEAKVEITVANFKSLLEQFYGLGRSSGVESKITSLFEQLFGRQG